MKKLAKSRLVKHLRQFTPEQIATKVQQKNLGPSLHNRSIKLIGQGAEGVAELVGDASNSVRVDKYYDLLKSPITNSGHLVKKLQAHKKLSTDPRTTNLFSKYIHIKKPINKTRTAGKSSSSFEPATPTLEKSIVSKAKLSKSDRKNVYSVAKTTLHDLQGTNIKNNKIVDFLDSSYGQTDPEEYLSKKLIKKIRPNRPLDAQKLSPKLQAYKNHLDQSDSIFTTFVDTANFAATHPGRTNPKKKKWLNNIKKQIESQKSPNRSIETVERLSETPAVRPLAAIKKDFYRS